MGRANTHCVANIIPKAILPFIPGKLTWTTATMTKGK